MEQIEDTFYREQPATNTHDKASEPGDVQLKHRLLQHLSWLLILGAILGFGLVYLLSEGFRDQVAVTWQVLSSGDQVRIREYIRSYGAWAPLASVLLMVS